MNKSYSAFPGLSTKRGFLMIATQPSRIVLRKLMDEELSKYVHSTSHDFGVGPADLSHGSGCQGQRNQ